MSEQIDIAVDLGVVPAPLPEIEFLREFVGNLPAPPAELVEGILHQGCKMVLGGTSKSNKSWCLLDLAISVASGEKWWGRRCAKMPVVYINFELHRLSIGCRLNSLCATLHQNTSSPCSRTNAYALAPLPNHENGLGRSGRQDAALYGRRDARRYVVAVSRCAAHRPNQCFSACQPAREEYKEPIGERGIGAFSNYRHYEQ